MFISSSALVPILLPLVIVIVWTNFISVAHLLRHFDIEVLSKPTIYKSQTNTKYFPTSPSSLPSSLPPWLPRSLPPSSHQVQVEAKVESWVLWCTLALQQAYICCTLYAGDCHHHHYHYHYH